MISAGRPSPDPPPRRRTILLAEDDDDLRDLLLLSLRSRGYDVVECRSGMDLVRHLSDFWLSSAEVSYDLLITDIRMPGLSGLEALDAMRSLQGRPPTIVITAFGDAETHAAARRLGAARVLDKPFEIDDLLDEADSLLLKTPED